MIGGLRSHAALPRAALARQHAPPASPSRTSLPNAALVCGLHSALWLAHAAGWRPHRPLGWVLFLTLVVACDRSETAPGVQGNTSAEQRSAHAPPWATNATITGRPASATRGGAAPPSAQVPPNPHARNLVPEHRVLDPTNVNVGSPALDKMPENFDDGRPVEGEFPEGFRCKLWGLGSWLQFRCRGANAAGALPKHASLSFKEERWEALPDAHGELRIAYRPHRSAPTTGYVEWNDGTRFEIVDISGSLHIERVSSEAAQEACAKLAAGYTDLKARTRVDESAQAPSPDEVARFPELGECKAAGMEYWALSPREVTAEGIAGSRWLDWKLDVVHVDAKGRVAAADFGPLRTKPGAVTFEPLSVFDYDSDGHAEVVVSYSMTANELGGAPTHHKMAWTWKAGLVAPFRRLPDP